MFAIMQQSQPIYDFSFENAPPTSQYRPSVSSPLSSSPIRASTRSPPPPLSSRDPNISSRPSQQYDTQSSPIAPSCSRKFSKFATRTPRPNPVVQKREDAQASRRNLFLKNVRDRADDKAWERRGGDQELLKLEWWRLTRELRQQKESELATIFPTDADIDDAEGIEEEILSLPRPQQPEMDVDDMMVDAIAQEEEAELEAMLGSLSREDTNMPEQRPDSPQFSEDDDYDSLFMDLLSQQEHEVEWSQDADAEMS